MITMPQMLLQCKLDSVLAEEDLAFADLVARIDGGQSADEPVLLAAALTFAAQRDGHTCLDLNTVAGKSLRELHQLEPVLERKRLLSDSMPELAVWIKSLSASKAVSVVNHESVATDVRPLVLDQNNRLYLHRFYRQEQDVAEALRQRAVVTGLAAGVFSRGELAELFDEAFGAQPCLQKLACFLAMTRNFFILSGGPGTGKTHTMARIAALLLTANPELRIHFAAPTGKAANRMVESIRAAKQGFSARLTAGRHIPEEAATLHRLLGVSADGRRIRKNQDNPIDADVVIVDEASMIALPMMAVLLNALEPSCRLILLGDMEQLASVDPGAVLGDLCRACGDPSHFSTTVARDFSAATGQDPAIPAVVWTEEAGSSRFQDCLVSLTESRRFSSDHPVAILGSAIRQVQDETEAAEAFEQMKQFGDDSEKAMILWHEILGRSLLDAEGFAPSQLRDVLWKGYLPLLNADSPQQALDALKDFRILCATRQGAFGVQMLNQITEDVLSMHGIRNAGAHAREMGAKRLLPVRAQFYPRQPIMITRNDYTTGLFNGDVGVMMEDETGQLKAWFETLDSNGHASLLSIAVSLLPPWQTAFASTIHKSQGSEFGNLAIVLSDKPTPQMTKELLYTALTRVKPDPKRPEQTGRIYLWGTASSFCAAARQATCRLSGLTDALIRP